MQLHRSQTKCLCSDGQCFRGRLTSRRSKKLIWPVLHDVFSTTVQPGAQKASYVLQFLWRDLTSSYDLVGPYFPISSPIQSGTLQELLMLTLKAFQAYLFRVSKILCDGKSSSLSLLKILTGYAGAKFPVNETAANLRDKYYLKTSFPNPVDPCGCVCYDLP